MANVNEHLEKKCLILTISGLFKKKPLFFSKTRYRHIRVKFYVLNKSCDTLQSVVEPLFATEFGGMHNRNMQISTSIWLHYMTLRYIFKNTE